MKIVIVGNGKVGFSLAEQLVREKYDVVIVDLREDTLRRAADALDIMSVKGNGISAATLIEAGAPDADLLVAATNSDDAKPCRHAAGREMPSSSAASTAP